MRALFYLFAAVLILSCCAPCRHVGATQEHMQDSVHTEVVTKTYFVTDTVFLEIPAQVSERTTEDSVSHLENDYATSEARITPDGTLYHDLRTKPQEMAFEYDKQVERKDITTHKTGTNTVVETKYVEKELTWWQQTEIYGFRVLAAFLVIGLAWKYRKATMAFIRKLI